jgi:hypothetical protein
MDSVKVQHLNPRGQLLQHPVHLDNFNDSSHNKCSGLKTKKKKKEKENPNAGK